MRVLFFILKSNYFSYHVKVANQTMHHKENDFNKSYLNKGGMIMLKIYKTTNSSTREINSFEKGAWINMYNPSEQEINKVCNNIKISEDFIKYALDSEEKARIDIDEDENTVLFIIDVPVIEEVENAKIYTTMPMGIIFVRDDYIITISIKENDVLKNLVKENKKITTFKKSRILLQILYNNAELFLTMLKAVNKESEIAEHILQKSMQNEEVLHMLNMEKSLVYLTTSLKANELVMEKTMRGKVIKLYEEDEDILEDAITENKQAIEMAKIYSDILTGTMDAYASIISNNLNGVMKFLTSITIVLAVPTMVSSFWGMNVNLPFQDSKFGFPIMILISVTLTLIVTWWLKRKDMLD